MPYARRSVFSLRRVKRKRPHLQNKPINEAKDESKKTVKWIILIRKSGDLFLIRRKRSFRRAGKITAEVGAIEFCKLK